jgi:dTDP-4-dehydrorhamnose 3,5-epimerase
MSRFTVTDLLLSVLKRVQRQRWGDKRSFMARLFCAEELEVAGWNKPIAQTNHNYTDKQETVRGMHFQRPPPCRNETGVLHPGGSVGCGGRPAVWLADFFTLARRANLGGKWLRPADSAGPCPCFQALMDDVQLLCCHSEACASQAEGGLNPNDPHLGIAWPLAIAELSARDDGQDHIISDFEGARA